MVDVKEAVKAASSYAQDLLGPKLEQLALEEVRFDERKRKWLVTLGFSRGLAKPPKRTKGALDLDFLNLQPKDLVGREYKVFDVDARTGKVLSMKIWK
ncbi:MAG TPA: hypothetical protein VN783_15585 [Thermoanaerobaculia bacterium]|nr:hypothetical protein [Thermoanaerobaculia bacterium]